MFPRSGSPAHRQQAGWRLRPVHICGDVELKVHSVVEQPADREDLAFATAHEEVAWATNIGPTRTATALCKMPGEYAIAEFGVGREADVTDRRCDQGCIASLGGFPEAFM